MLCAGRRVPGAALCARFPVAETARPRPQRERSRGPPGRNGGGGGDRGRRLSAAGDPARASRPFRDEPGRDGGRRDGARIPDRLSRGGAGDAARDRGLRRAGVRRGVHDALARDLPSERPAFSRKSCSGATSATACSRSEGERCASTTCTRVCACRLPAPREAALSELFGIDAEVLAAAFAIAGESADKAEKNARLTAYLETDAAPDAAHARHRDAGRLPKAARGRRRRGVGRGQFRAGSG